MALKPTVTVSELAVRTGLSRATIIRYIQAGMVPACRLAARGHFRVPRDTAEAIVRKLNKGQ